MKKTPALTIVTPRDKFEECYVGTAMESKARYSTSLDVPKESSLLLGGLVNWYLIGISIALINQESIIQLTRMLTRKE